MRTVDPELWYRTMKKPRIQVTRTMKYGTKPASGVEGLIRASFMDAMREFRSNCSVRAVVRIGGIRDNWQKNIHIIALVVSLWIGIFVVGYDIFWLGNTPPLLISLQPSQRAAMSVHFPAVALCSTSIFSVTALDNYIEFLAIPHTILLLLYTRSSKDNNSTYTKAEIRKNLLNFGALLNRAPPPAPVDVMFNRFLMRVLPKFNLTGLMLKLSPPCSSMLRRCSWRGRLLPCDKLFATRITPLGFCCVFNSRYQPEDINTEPKVLDMVGQDFGLTFLVQNDIDEFVYARRPSVGYEILLFEGSEYPLVEGGGVRTFPVERDVSMFVAVSVRAEEPSHTLEHYNEIWRGCRLREPSVHKSWRSSHSWCLSWCRRRTIAAMCSCTPHTLPSSPSPSPTHTSSSTPPLAPVCTPDNLVCLNKHREKFMYYYPGEQSEQWSPALGEELQDSQDCLDCMPDCLRLVYSANVAYTHYQYRDKIFQNFVSKGISLVNTTVVRVFYTSEHQHRLYVVEGYMRWYEAVALISSEWVSVMGVTVLIVIELVFYCFIRWPHHYRRRVRDQHTKRTDETWLL